MRNALKSAGACFARVLPLLLMIALVGATNASAAAEGAGGYMGTSPGTAAALGIGALTIGAVVNLSARDPESGDEKSVVVDTENDDSQSIFEKVKQAARLKADELIYPKQQELEATQKENDGLREIIVGECLRVKKLAAGTDDDGESTLDVENERAYLEGLPADRLKMEYQRLPKVEELDTSQATTEGTPQGGGEDVYADFKS